MSVLQKQPSDALILFIEFEEMLATGDSLAAITSVVEATGTITIASTSITGTKVRGTYSGGVDGAIYHIVATVTTVNGETLEADVYLYVVETPSTTITASYFSLLERVGHYLFGMRSGYSADQIWDIEDCLKDGLRDVYASHDWSFFHPIKDVTTTPPYTTGTIEVVAGVVTLTTGTFPSWAAEGTLKASSSYYSIATRDSGTQITLDDTTVAIAALTTYELGRPEIPLADAFEAVANDSDLTYYPDQNELYPPVRQLGDQSIRTWQQDDPSFDRPVFYSVRTVEFVATVGSRKRLTFYPTPDANYVLRVPQILRPTMITATSPFPVGGETLSQVITEACLMAAERNFEERENVHAKRYHELLPLAIAMDQQKSSPTSLGGGMPKGEGNRYNNSYEDYYHLRSSRIGGITLGGDAL